MMSASLRKHLQLAIALIALQASEQASATVSAVDDSGRRITLAAPAARIISLAPHITELLYAAGAGPAVVGVSAWSDYPAAAQKLAVVADGARLELERIIDLQPDLVIAWKSGSSARQVARLRKLGLTVFESEPRSFEDIARSMERFAVLAGATEGKKAAASLRERLQDLREQYEGRTRVSVFYQIWPSPLMTLNARHMVSDALKLCGATNIFGKLAQIAPTVSIEAVVGADPDAIIISDERRNALERWRSLPQMKAVRYDNLFNVDGTLMNRAGPRIIEGTTQLCERIDTARKHLHDAQ